MVVQVARGAADLVVSMAAWWTEADSVDPTAPAVVAAQGMTRPLILVILVGGVLVQSVRIILSRKGEPAAMVATGLVRYAAVSAFGLVALQIGLRAGDALAADLLDGAVGNFAQYLQDQLAVGEGDSVFVVLLVALIAAVLSLVQWLLMALRQAGLLVLAAMLPLAASGSLTRSTHGWLGKLLAWLVALAAYKPAAAFIYYIGFSYLSSPDNSGQGVAPMLTGIMVLLLAVIAMPVLLKFFAWSGTQLGGASGGGSGFLGAVGAVAMTGAPGRSAVDRAAAVEADGPGSYARFGQHPPTSMPTGAAPAASGGTATGVARTSGAAGGSAAAGTGVGAGAVGGVVAGGAAAAAGVRAAGRGMTGGVEDAPGAGPSPGSGPQ
ncbi:MAG: hypothetical protein NTW05_03740 [Pseudonocardiales bacterium]|nr:hypothetical protein [Pseudonocardiales bacterium]